MTAKIDSQIGALLRTSTHDRGISGLAFELQWTLMDAYGPKTAVFKTAGGRPQKSVQVHICPLTSAASVDDSQ